MTDFNIDSHKLAYHPARVAEWLEKGDCFPIYVEIGPTNRCNHQCIFCALDWLKRGGSDIGKEAMFSSIKDMASHGVKSVMFAGEGEPLLHKDISEFVKYSKENEIDISITTNGVLFDKEKANQCLPYLSWIRFSVDAGDRDSYSIIHKTKKEDFDKVIENICYASELKKKLNFKSTIGVQALLTSSNINSMEKLAEICRDAGADNLQIKPYSHHPSSHNDISVPREAMILLEEKLKSIRFNVIVRKDTAKRIEDFQPYCECHGIPFFALIDSRGNVMPCNLYYHNPEFTYGNLYEQSFSEIWLGEKRKDVLKKLKTKGIEDCRKGCRIDPSNRYLERIVNPQPHDNFI